MKLKVCGITNLADLKALEKLALETSYPNYIGHIFYDQSKRDVSKSLEALNYHSKIERVGVFVNAELETIKDICSELDLKTVQLHGTEDPAFCLALKNSYTVIKAIPFNLLAEHKKYQGSVDYLLIDNLTGGSGKAFDLKILSNTTIEIPFFIAGGIGLLESREIKKLQLTNFVGLDVNSKFELAPGIKNLKMLKELCYELSKS